MSGRSASHDSSLPGSATPRINAITASSRQETLNANGRQTPSVNILICRRPRGRITEDADARGLEDSPQPVEPAPLVIAMNRLLLLDGPAFVERIDREVCCLGTDALVDAGIGLQLLALCVR